MYKSKFQFEHLLSPALFLVYSTPGII